MSKHHTTRDTCSALSLRIFLFAVLLGWSPVFGDPWDIAHRGGSFDAPENTIVTFNNSIDLGPRIGWRSTSG